MRGREGSVRGREGSVSGREGSVRGREGGMRRRESSVRGGKGKGDKTCPNSNITFLTAEFYIKLDGNI